MHERVPRGGSAGDDLGVVSFLAARWGLICWESNATRAMERLSGRPSDLASTDRGRQRRLDCVDATHRHRAGAFVVSVPQYIPAAVLNDFPVALPDDVHVFGRRGACIVSPGGDVIAGPLYDAGDRHRRLRPSWRHCTPNATSTSSVTTSRADVLSRGTLSPPVLIAHHSEEPSRSTAVRRHAGRRHRAAKHRTTADSTHAARYGGIGAANTWRYDGRVQSAWNSPRTSGQAKVCAQAMAWPVTMGANQAAPCRRPDKGRRIDRHADIGRRPVLSTRRACHRRMRRCRRVVSQSKFVRCRDAAARLRVDHPRRDCHQEVEDR